MLFASMCVCRIFECRAFSEEIVNTAGDSGTGDQVGSSADIWWLRGERETDSSNTPLHLINFLLFVLRKDLKMFLMHNIQPLLQKFLVNLPPDQPPSLWTNREFWHGYYRDCVSRHPDTWDGGGMIMSGEAFSGLREAWLMPWQPLKSPAELLHIS